MWETLAHGFLYVYTGMVVGTTGSVLVVTNKVPGTAADWIAPAHALIDRSLATYYATNNLAQTTVTVARVAWESNSLYSYVRTEVTNWGSTNTEPTNTCSTNFFTNLYLYGLQEYSVLVRYNEPDGFDVVSTSTPWFKMSNYRVSPLIWGGGGYTVGALSNTTPTVLTDFRVAGQAGRYVYNWATNNWPYWTNSITTNSEGVISTTVVPSIVVTVEGGVTNAVTNGPSIWTTSLVETVFLDYAPTNQRPNAITPLMGRSHLVAMDNKFDALLPYYYDSTKAVGGSFDDYCATTGVYWASNYYVGAIWFEEDKILSTTTQTWSYQPTTWNPAKEISSIVTSIVAGTSSNYTWATNIPIEVAGTEEDHDREVAQPIGDPQTSWTEMEGWSQRQWPHHQAWADVIHYGEIGGTAGDHTRETVVANIIWSGGSAGSEDDYNDVKFEDENAPDGTFSSSIIGGGIVGVGADGEIDYYTYTEIAGTESNYTRSVYIDTTPGTEDHYTSLTISNYTMLSSLDHYNRISNSYNSICSRTWIWSGVSNILAGYMTPWVVDHTNADINWTTNSLTSGQTNYYNTYLYNYGWSPSYNTGWRIYTEGVTPIATPHYYWDWVETNYYHANYEYFLNDPGSGVAYHYERRYSYYWKYPTEAVYTYYKDGSWTNSEYLTFNETQWYSNPPPTYLYYKTVDNYNYTLQVLTENYVIKEPLYTIKYQVYPTPPPVYSLSSFMRSHSNMLGSTNWMISPAYLSESNVFLSNHVYVVTNSGVISVWTNNYYANMVVTNRAVYSNEFARSLWAASFQSRYAAYTSLVWCSGGAVIESKTRSLTTTNETAPTWSTIAITTNLSGGTYNCSIYTYWPGWPGYAGYTFSKTVLRARRLAPVIFDGEIDVYLQFGTTPSGRYDLEGLGYTLGPWVKVIQLTIPAGSMYSEWLGDISIPPTFPNLADYTYHHPWGFTIQNSSGTPTFVFKPVFD